jgi:hypothetical protein
VSWSVFRLILMQLTMALRPPACGLITPPSAQNSPYAENPSEFFARNTRISATLDTPFILCRNQLTSAYLCYDGIGAFRGCKCGLHFI